MILNKNGFIQSSFLVPLYFGLFFICSFQYKVNNVAAERPFFYLSLCSIPVVTFLHIFLFNFARFPSFSFLIRQLGFISLFFLYYLVLLPFEYRLLADFLFICIYFYGLLYFCYSIIYSYGDIDYFLIFRRTLHLFSLFSQLIAISVFFGFESNLPFLF